LEHVLKLVADATAASAEESLEGGGTPIFVCSDVHPAGESQVDLVFDLVNSAVSIEQADPLAQVTVRAPCGLSNVISLPSPGGTVQTEHFHLLSLMLQSHAAGRDMCLIGKAGAGKSFMSRLFARALGYAPVQTLFIYQDMTARDLLQRRATDEFGATTWIPTPLTVAMREGRLAVLDGIHRLPLGTISALLRLLDEREITLFDGTSFVCPARYAEMQERLGYTDADLAARGIYRVHPSFCVLALANPPTRQDPWLNNEVLHLFHFFTVEMDLSSTVGQGRNADLLQAIVPGVPRDFAESMSKFAMHMERMGEDPLSSVTSPVSLRQMLRMARRAAQHPSELHSSLYNACMMMYMPKTEKEAVVALMDTVGILRNDEEYSVSALALVVTDADGKETSDYSQGATLQIGDVIVKCASPENPALVPDVVFFHIPMHTRLLRSMLQDFLLGEHLLLIGNQGVGKNKLTDRLLQLMRREREYIQLHRDTTVPALTLTPTLVDGKIVWEDSPLVKALINGRVLMIDEADKAPTEVVCVLKGLLEDGEILLGDGRRFISSKSQIYAGLTDDQLPDNVHRIHDDFRVISLANRPGYPFLGNDFFAEMGDVFAVYAIDNPDQQSEIEMLQSYSDGAVPVSMLYKLTSAFQDLRQMTDDGTLSYPYSTRELVNVVKHISMFPDDNITQVLENVFAFDSFDGELRRSLYESFQRHGIPLGGQEADGAGVANDLAVASALQAAAIQTAMFTRATPDSIDIPIATSALVEDWNRGLGQQPGYSPLQIRSMDSKVSARVNRFTEEVMGFSLLGNDEPCINGMVSLDDNTVAVLTQTNELQIADPDNAVVKTIGINNGAPEVFASVCEPPLAAAKSLNKLLTFNTLREILIVVDPEDGSAVPMVCSLDPPEMTSGRSGGGSRASGGGEVVPNNDRLFFGRMEVALVDGFETCGCCILHRVGDSVLCFVHYDLATASWLSTKLTLPSDIKVAKFEIIFARKFLIRTEEVQLRDGFGNPIKSDGPSSDVYELTLTGENGVFPPATASLVKLAEAHTEGVNAENPLFLSKPYRTIRSVTQQSDAHHMFCAPDIYGGYTVGFSEDEMTPDAVATRWSLPRDPSEMQPDTTPPVMRRRFVACALSSAPATVMAISNPQELGLELINLDTGMLKQIQLGFKVGDAPPDSTDGDSSEVSVNRSAAKHAHVYGVAEMADGRIAVLQQDGVVRIVELREDELAADESEWQTMMSGNAELSAQQTESYENEALQAGVGAAESAIEQGDTPAAVGRAAAAAAGRAGGSRRVRARTAGLAAGRAVAARGGTLQEAGREAANAAKA
jgi:MoxR-like ATPase